MSEPTNRAKMIGAARRSLLNSGVEYWCERDDLPLDAAIDAIDAARQAADMETYIEAINEAFWKKPHQFRRRFEKTLSEQANGSVLLDEIDGHYEWALTEALDELPNGVKGEIVARDQQQRKEDLRAEVRAHE